MTAVVVRVATQGTLGNPVAGLSSVISQAVQVGDVIRLAVPARTLNAEVRMIPHRSTLLLGDDSHKVVVLNRVITEEMSPASQDLRSMAILSCQRRCCNRRRLSILLGTGLRLGRTRSFKCNVAQAGLIETPVIGPLLLL